MDNKKKTFQKMLDSVTILFVNGPKAAQSNFSYNNEYVTPPPPSLSLYLSHTNSPTGALVTSFPMDMNWLIMWQAECAIKTISKCVFFLLTCWFDPFVVFKDVITEFSLFSRRSTSCCATTTWSTALWTNTRAQVGSTAIVTGFEAVKWLWHIIYMSP